MNLILSILFIMILVFTCVVFSLFARFNDVDGRITLLEIKANYCEQSEKTLRKSVDLQTKCIRDLNDIVKKSVENKEPTEPDTKALLAGWVVEEGEPELQKKQPQQVDVLAMQRLISSMNYKNLTPLYPWQQVELNQTLGPYGIREERMNETIFS